MEINWVVRKLDRKVDTGAVVVAHWTVSMGPTVYGGATSFVPDESSPDFIPYEDLTHDHVLGWVWSHENKDGIEAALKASFPEDDSTLASGVPWSN